MIERMAALANKLDEKGHPDLADKFDGMTKSAGLFGGLAKLPFKTLGLGLRGLGSGLKFLGHHPYLTTGAGLGALTKLNYDKDPQAGIWPAIGNVGRDVWDSPRRLSNAWEVFKDPDEYERILRIWLDEQRKNSNAKVRQREEEIENPVIIPNEKEPAARGIG